MKQEGSDSSLKVMFPQAMLAPDWGEAALNVRLLSRALSDLAQVPPMRAAHTSAWPDASAVHSSLYRLRGSPSAFPKTRPGA